MSAVKFYAENVVTLANGTGPGGGTDFFGRMVASYWPAHVEGGAMRVRNIEGAQYVNMLNAVLGAEPDGSFIGIGSNGGSTVFPALYGLPNVNWKKGDFTYLGSRIEDQYVLQIATHSDIETIDQLLAEEGGTISQFSIESGSDRAACLAIQILGLKDWKMVRGYQNLIDAALGAGRGDTTASALDPNNGWEAIANGWLKEPILTLSLRRSPFFPDVPAIPEIAEVPAEWVGPFSVADDWTGRYNFFCNSKVPADRIEFLRNKFLEINEGAGFLRQAKLKWPNLDTPLSGEQLEEIMDRAWDVTQADVDKLSELQQELGR